MKNTPQFLHNYIISYSRSLAIAGKPAHYSNAELFTKSGNIIKLKNKYYKTMDEAVNGIIKRITEAIIEYNLEA